MMPSTHAPTISIIIATYNRSNVLIYAIQSVLRNTFEEWELIVVGDACTDDTAEVVLAFNDPRIRFINLERNIGEQSGPNNAGFQQARGRYIAYLNHDDLWLPQHLAEALAALIAQQADFVYTLGITILPNGERWPTGATRSTYEPYLFVPASTWLIKREWIEQLGGWHSYRRSFNVPSQDFIYRAWKAGARLYGVTQVTTILITSGNRRNSYAERQSAEHAQFYQRMVDDPAFVARELTLAALAFYRRSEGVHPGLHAYRFGRSLLYVVCMRLGLPPLAVVNWLKHGRKGATLDRLRAIRGLGRLR